MREIVKRVMAYQYDELSDEARDKAVEGMYDINVDHEWWEFTFEDANNIGLEITEFDSYHGTIGGKLTQDANEVVMAIQDNHGESCDTYKLSKEYEGRLYKLDEDEEEIEDEEKASEFERALLEEYLSILRKEYEYLTGREAIEEIIRANEYEFTEDGTFPAI